MNKKSKDIKINKKSGWIVVAQDPITEEWYPCGSLQETKEMAQHAYLWNLSNNGKYPTSWDDLRKQGFSVIEAKITYNNPLIQDV